MLLLPNWFKRSLVLSLVASGTLSGCVGGESGSVSESMKAALSTNTSSIGANEGDTIAVNLNLDVAAPVNVPLIWSLQKKDAATSSSLISSITSYFAGSRDFDAMSGELVMTEGSRSAQLSLPSRLDNLYEGTEDFVLVVSGQNIKGSLKIPISLVDADAIPVISASPIYVNEGDRATLIFTLNHPSELPVKFKIQSIDDTATSPLNFNAVTLTDVEIPPFSLTFVSEFQTLTNPDNVNKRFFAALSNPQNATFSSAIISGASQIAINIVDGGAMPVSTLSVADVTVAENVGNAAITVAISPASPSILKFDYSLVGQTAVSGLDFSNVSGTAVSIPANATSFTFTVPITDDSFNESDEKFLVQLSNPVGGVLGDYQAVATIVDNDSRPKVDFALVTSEEVEASGGATKLVHIGIRVTGLTTQDLTIPFTLGGTAANWTTGTPDYQFLQSSFTIPAGSTTAEIVIPVVSDSNNEPDETIVLTLTAATLPLAIDLGTNNIHTFTIKNDDGAPAFIVESQSVSEGSELKIPVTKSGSTGASVTVNYTIDTALLTNAVDLNGINADVGAAGSGLTSLTGSLVFAPSESVQYISIPTLDDNSLEPDEKLRISISLVGVNATLATVTTASAVSTVKDTDTLNITIDQSAQADEGDPVVFKVCKSIPVTQDILVTYNTTAMTATGGDFTTATAATLTIPLASTCADLSIATTEDSAFEADETFKVTITAPRTTASVAMGVILGNGQGIGTIKNDDANLIFQFAQGSSITTTESGTHDVTVQVTGGAPASTVSVNYTLASGAPAAVLGTDYGASASQETGVNATTKVVTFSAGETSKVIKFDVLNDADQDPGEKFLLSLTTPVGGTLSGATFAAHTVTINDDDSKPRVQFAAATSSVPEGSPSGITSASITVELLDGVLAGPVTIPFTVTGTATAEDFALSPASSITIPANTSSATINVSIVKDSGNEPDETVSLTLGTLPATVLAAPIQNHILTITNDDGAPTFLVESVMSTEGSDLVIPVKLTGSSSSAITVNYAVSAGATDPATLQGTASDVGTNAAVGLASLTGTLVFNAGETIRTITIPTIDDSAVEANEKLKVTISLVGANATLGTIPSGNEVATSTIKDNDSLNVTIAGTAQANEGDAMTFSVCKTNPVSSNFNVTYQTTDVTANGGVDYTAVASGTLVMQAANECETITIATTEDANDEADETFKVTLLTTAQGTLVTNSKESIGTIKDDDDLLVLELAQNASTTTTESGTHSVTVRVKSGTPSGSMSVKFNLSDGATPAQQNIDYQLSATQDAGVDAATKTVTFGAGETSKVIKFSILADAFPDPNESFVINLMNPTNATLTGATNTTHAVTINDDDTTPKVEFALAASNPSEGSGGGLNKVTVTVKLVDGVLNQDVLIPFGVAGTAAEDGDYSLAAHSITIPAGQNNASIVVSLFKDSDNEPGETVIFTVSAGTLPASVVIGTVTTHTLTITNDDGTPTISIAAATSFEDSQMIIPVTMTGTSASSISVNYTISTGVLSPAVILTGAGSDVGTAGSGLGSLTGTLTFAPGETSKSIPVWTLADSLVEGDEKFQVDLSLTAPNAALAALATSTALATVKDLNTLNLTLDNLAQATEGSPMTFKITKSTPVATNVIVTFKTNNGSATSPADFTGATSTTVTLLPGDTSKQFTVTTIDDNEFEPDENFELEVTSVNQGTLLGNGKSTATIKDNDAPRTVTFDTGASITANESGTHSIAVKLTQASSGVVVVNYGISAGSPAATQGSDYALAGSQATGVTATTVTFQPGDLVKQINFTVTDDDEVDAFEQFKLTISSPTGDAVLGATTVHTITIQDNDVPPTIESFTPAAGNLSAKPATVQVQFSKLMQTSAVTNTANWTVTCPGTVTLSSVSALDSGGKTRATLNLAGTATVPSTCAIEAKLAITDLGLNTLPSSAANRTVSYYIFATAAVTMVTSSKIDGCYGVDIATPVNSEIPIRVYFSEAVTVTPGPGSAYPRVTLETGTTDAQVDLTTGSGTNVLEGTYTISQGHMTNTLSVNSLTLNTATIVGAVSGVTISSLSIPGGQNLSDLKAIGVDTAAPPVVSFAGSEGGDGIYGTSTSESPPILYNVVADVGCAGTVKYEGKIDTVGAPWYTMAYGGKVPGTFANGSTYKVVMRASDRLGNMTVETKTDGWVVDRTAPTTPTAPTVGTDPVIANHKTTPNLSWTNSTDVGGSGVSHYQIQILEKTYTGSTQVYPATLGTWITHTKGSPIDMTSTPLTVGSTYVFKVRAIDYAANVSGESAESNQWTAMGECPLNYVKIAANPTLGVGKDFCVSRYEMRAVSSVSFTLTNNGLGNNIWEGNYTNQAAAARGDGQPFSTGLGAAGQGGTVGNAKNFCTKLNGDSIPANTKVGYDLMSNSEWMTIARNAEARVENWSGGAVGSGHLPVGNDSGTVLRSTSDCLYAASGTCNTTGTFKYRRTMKVKLADDTYADIWDLAGNVEELVETQSVASPPTITNNMSYSYDQELASGSTCLNANAGLSVAPGGGNGTSCYPNGVKYLPSNTTWTHASHNIGWIKIVTNNHGLVRGGYGTTRSGLYSIYSDNVAAGTWGIRCIYRLP